MLSSADAIGKIQQIYMSGDRQVPYLTFMSVFNDLLEDPAEVVPKEPNEELAEKFRAACMAAHAGVLDSEGRAEDRLREFQEKVVPVWKEALPPEKWSKYEDILGGQMRQKFRKKKQEDAGSSAEIAVSATGKSSELLRRLGITPAGEQGAEIEEEIEVGEEEEFELEEPATAEAEVEPEAVEADSEVFHADEKARAEAPTEVTAEEAPPQEFETVDDLVQAVHDEEVWIEFKPRAERKLFARYGLGDGEVEVYLVAGNTRNYVVLSIGRGRPEALNARQMMDDMMLEMGYRATSDFYYRRREGDFLLRVRMWPDRIDMACGYPKGESRQTLVRQIQKAHRDLGEVLERLEG